MKPNIIALIIVFIYANVAFSDSVDTEIDKIIQLSGVEKQVAQLPDMAKASFMQAQQQQSIPQEKISSIFSSLDKHITPSTIINDIRASLTKTLSPSDRKSLLAWYQSDVAKKITDAEVKATTAEAYNDMLSSAEKLAENTERIEQAARFDELTKATEMTVEMQEASSMAAFAAVMTSLAPDEPLNLESFKVQLAEARPQTEEGTYQLVILSILYTYQALDDETLAQYEKFLGQPYAAKLHEALFKAISDGMPKMMTKLIEDFSVIIKKPES